MEFYTLKNLYLAETENLSSEPVSPVCDICIWFKLNWHYLAAFSNLLNLYATLITIYAEALSLLIHQYTSNQNHLPYYIPVLNSIKACFYLHTFVSIQTLIKD